MTALVPVTRTIVDNPQALESMLRAAHQQGRLVSRIEEIKAAPTARDPNLWWVQVQLLEKPGWRVRLARLDAEHPIAGPMLKALAFGLIVVAVLLGVVVGLIEVVAHTVSGRDVSVGLGVLVLLAVLAAFAFGRTPGRHASHDGKGWHYTDCK